MKPYSIGILATLALTLGVQAQNTAPQKLSDTLYVLYASGTNVGLVIGDKGLTLIDTGISENTHKQLEAAIREISDKPFQYLINTHSHTDHAGGNNYFSNLGATIVSHENIRYLDKENERYKGTYNQILFEKKINLDIGSEKIGVYRAMAHGSNHVTVHLPNNNVVFTGDNHSTNWGPNLGLDGFKGQNEAIKQALSLTDDNTTVVPGHGEITDSRHLKGYGDRFAIWVERVLQLHEQGMSPEEIAADESSLEILLTFNEGNRNAGILVPYRLAMRVRFLIDTATKMASPLPPAALHKYVGNYLSEDGPTIEFKMLDDQIYAMEEGEYFTILFPQSATSFDWVGYGSPNGSYEFELDSMGNPVAVSYIYNGVTRTGRKKR